MQSLSRCPAPTYMALFVQWRCKTASCYAGLMCTVQSQLILIHFSSFTCCTPFNAYCPLWIVICSYSALCWKPQLAFVQMLSSFFRKSTQSPRISLLRFLFLLKPITQKPPDSHPRSLRVSLSLSLSLSLWKALQVYRYTLICPIYSLV
jgi:hypothetical protein